MMNAAVGDREQGLIKEPMMQGFGVVDDGRELRVPAPDCFQGEVKLKQA